LKEQLWQGRLQTLYNVANLETWRTERNKKVQVRNALLPCRILELVFIFYILGLVWGKEHHQWLKSKGFKFLLYLQSMK
jgi:hypothetical protein